MCNHPESFPFFFICPLLQKWACINYINKALVYSVFGWVWDFYFLQILLISPFPQPFGFKSGKTSLLPAHTPALSVVIKNQDFIICHFVNKYLSNDLFSEGTLADTLVGTKGGPRKQMPWNEILGLVCHICGEYRDILFAGGVQNQIGVILRIL